MNALKTSQYIIHKIIKMPETYLVCDSGIYIFSVLANLIYLLNN